MTADMDAIKVRSERNPLFEARDQAQLDQIRASITRSQADTIINLIRLELEPGLAGRMDITKVVEAVTTNNLSLLVPRS